EYLDAPARLDHLDLQPFRIQRHGFVVEGDLPAVNGREEFGLVVRYQVDDVLFQRTLCREGRRVAHCLFGPVGIAAVSFGQATDVGDGVVQDLPLHGAPRNGRFVLRVVHGLVGSFFAFGTFAVAFRVG